MELDWIIVCEYATRDKANKLSVLGEFTSVFLPKFPGQMPIMYVVLRWKVDEGIATDFSDNVKIVNSRGEVVAEAPLSEASVEPGRRITTVRRFEFVTFPSPDMYFVEAYWKGQLMGKDHFFVRAVSA